MNIAELTIVRAIEQDLMELNALNSADFSSPFILKRIWENFTVLLAEGYAEEFGICQKCNGPTIRALLLPKVRWCASCRTFDLGGTYETKGAESCSLSE